MNTFAIDKKASVWISKGHLAYSRLADLPCKFLYKNAMIDVMKVYIILHNMIVEDERD
uniref:Uncharacterized protein n=1 Tax=Hyaloperonospora arabidopsidis (strain Emoy2) TaxID=559515 RepID=M4BBG4_HYAAE